MLPDYKTTVALLTLVEKKKKKKPGAFLRWAMRECENAQGTVPAAVAMTMTLMTRNVNSSTCYSSSYFEVVFDVASSLFSFVPVENNDAIKRFSRQWQLKQSLLCGENKILLG